MGNDISWAIISQESVAAIVFVFYDYSEQPFSSHCFGKAFPTFLLFFFVKSTLWEMLSHKVDLTKKKSKNMGNAFPKQ